MNIKDIIEQLTKERGRIDTAITALEEVGGISSTGSKRRGRPPGSTATKSAEAPVRKRRTMSAAARKLISIAQKKRWAAQKKAAKKG